MHVSEIMSKPVIGIAASATIAEAAAVMLAHRVSGLPVIDNQQRIVGVITEGDFLRRAELGTAVNRPRWHELFVSPGKLADEYVHSHGRKVAEIMSPTPVTVAPGALLEEAVELMLNHHIKRLPVVDAARVMGIVSRSDLMRALITAQPQVNEQPVDDARIGQAVRSELARQDWTSSEMTRIGVKDGVVKLEGMIFDERQRNAIKVVAENVPGVKAVDDHLAWIEPLSGMVVLAPQDRQSTDSDKPIATAA